MTNNPDFININWRSRSITIEYRWVGTDHQKAPLLIFLHEGLGSVNMWKDFPERLCREAGYRGLVYSRPGYGQSTPRAADESWGADFLHQQAYEVLPALLDALEIEVKTDPPWLFGHSDGASIALLYAARFPEQLSGAIVLAPHIMVEDISISSIEQARQAYLETDLKQRLRRYHHDPDSAFWGWNNIWLNPDFRDWSITDTIKAIKCPLLAVQGVDDEYGTLEQIHGIAQRLPHTKVLKLTQCRHSPHRDQPEKLIKATKQFISNT